MAIVVPAPRLVLPTLSMVPVLIDVPAFSAIAPAATRLSISISPAVALSVTALSPLTLPMLIDPGALMVSAATLSRLAVVKKLLPVWMSKLLAK